MGKGKKPKARKRAKPSLSRETLKNLTPGRAARVRGGAIGTEPFDSVFCSGGCPAPTPKPAPGPSPAPLPTPTPRPK